MTHDGSNIFLVIVCLVAAPFIYYWTEVARRKRNELKFRIKRIVLSEFVFLFGIVILVKQGYKPIEAAAFSFMSAVAVGFLFVRPPKRDRRIPRYVRQAVIARDLKGAPFDPQLHQLHHIVPYSKGGDHSVENLRVLTRTENRRRGAKMPKFRDF